MYRYIKRISDFLSSFIGLLILSPVFLIVFFLLLIVNSGKPFFFQSRPGKNEKIFRIIKFKTMNDKKDANGNFLPFDKRVTKIGSFLRKTSLDEIPQLINVFIGQMSLIGPRPLLVKYLPLYNDFQKKRHSIKPGVTGWAQVNGRNAISWDEKFEFDIWYTQNVSLKLDFKILLLTIKKVIYSEEVNSGENINMEPFLGSKVKK
ncbi:MAG: undecaprenyl phosphate N,N'-diacetylbacillosamine 1-phosphate transferase [Flavobacteriaceae bacterium]|jgi:undecaprenyl phosphate N,N'-diacetylbacillosamine 1-phosphate transferase